MIKIFGLERTFTHYLRELLSRNLNEIPCQTLFGDTHGKTDLGYWLDRHPEHKTWVSNNTADFIICVKNPYTWIDSMLRFFKVMQLYRVRGIDWQLKRYNDTYLRWHRELIEAEHPFFKNGLIIRYEDLLADPLKELNRVRNLENFVDVDKVELSDHFTEERKKNYLNPSPEKEKIEIVNRNVSVEFFELYGYDKKN